MFYDCESLVEFFNFEMNDNEIKDNIIEREQVFCLKKHLIYLN